MMHDDGESVAQLVVRALEQARGDETLAAQLFIQWMLADPKTAERLVSVMESPDGREAAFEAVQREARRIVTEIALRQGRMPPPSADPDL